MVSWLAVGFDACQADGARFMDAEIGVRNLADPFRYNMLPQIAKAIGLGDEDIDNLPDFERLAVLVGFPRPLHERTCLTTAVSSTTRAELRNILVLHSGWGPRVRHTSGCRAILPV